MSNETTLATSGSYAIDPSHTLIGFVARYAMVTKVRGSFTEFSGSAHFDADNLSNSSLELTIQSSSITTGNSDRDGHLRADDFFDAAVFPEITFISKDFKQVDGERYSITGDLTMKGIAKSVTIELEYTGSAVDPYQNQRVGFEGKASLSRKDWGLNWNAALEAGGVLVADKVVLEFEISAIRAAVSA